MLAGIPDDPIEVDGLVKVPRLADSGIDNLPVYLACHAGMIVIGALGRSYGRSYLRNGLEREGKGLGKLPTTVVI